jgi:hypothetical protein
MLNKSSTAPEDGESDPVLVSSEINNGESDAVYAGGEVDNSELDPVYVSGEFDDGDLDPVHVNCEFDNGETCLSTDDALRNTASTHLPAPTLGSVSNSRSTATAPAAEKRPRLEDLTGDDLCRLLATCGLAEQQYIVKEQTLNGMFIVCWRAVSY